MPWRPFPRVKFARSWGHLAVSRYANISALYSVFGQRFKNLTTARPIRTNRPRAQVVELVDALASGASGLTAVKVRVLSWAPFAPKPMISLKCGPIAPLIRADDPDTAFMACRITQVAGRSGTPNPRRGPRMFADGPQCQVQALRSKADEVRMTHIKARPSLLS